MKPLLIKEHRLIFLDEVDSTNNYATRLLATENVEEGTIVLTFRQTLGRGNGKNVWESENFKNLTFSMVLFPQFLPASSQFLLSQVISLGIFDFLSSKTAGAAIKWPNDLFIHQKKVAGILIENSVMGEKLQSSVIGIGININQTNFPDHLPQATSLALQTEKVYSLQVSLQSITDSIMNWYEKLRNKQTPGIEEAYLDNLFRKGEKSLFRKDNQVFEAEIAGVDPYGQLLLKFSSGNITAFPFKSVEMIHQARNGRGPQNI